MKKIKFIISFLLMASVCVAQYSVQEYIIAGDLAMSRANYHGAMVNYGNALELTSGTPELWFKYGKAAIRQNAYNKAEMIFDKYINELEGEQQAPALYYLAQAQNLKGKYPEAINNYNLFLSEYPDFNDKALVKQVEKGLASAQWAGEQPEVAEGVNAFPVEGDVNTPSSEHSPYLLDDELYFASLRYPVGKKEEKTLFSKVLVHKDGTSEPLANLMDDENTGMMSSNPSFSPDGTLMFYTLCQYGFEDKIDCNIYYARRNQEGNYQNATKLASDVNFPNYTATHPNVKVDGERMILYFVSDRPGGKGGLDIWHSNFNKNMIFSPPVNEDFNTRDDDITPFFHHGSQTLYFSSNGRDGFGGFDIYKNIGAAVTNLGRGYNTSYNDIYYYLNDDESTGYLASNRLGSKYSDDSFESCCYDIYQLDIENQTIDMLALIFDGVTKEPLSNARVVLKNLRTGEVLYDSSNPDSNDHKVKINCQDEYEVTVYKDGYADYSDVLGPYTEDCGKGPIEEKIFMQPGAIDLLVNTIDKTTLEALNYTKVKLICLSTGQELEKTTGSTNQTSFTLDPTCQSWRLIGIRDGYENGLLDFSTAGLTGKVSKDLPLTKTQIATLEGLVPVRLYFNNDHPNPGSNSQETNLWYSETYEKFYPLKGKFAEKYAIIKSSTGRQEVNSFFDGEVKKGNDDLQLMLTTLLEVMKSGQVVNLYLRGYASPLAQEIYNLALGQRRVESVKNEIKKWNGGILMKYINSGQLIITVRSFGENEAPTGISDSEADALNSIYGPSASRERRVEIDEIRFDN